jgi:hypothetical protein
MAQVWGEVLDTARRGGLMPTQEGMSWVVWRDPSCPPGPGGEPGGLESCSSPQTYIRTYIRGPAHPATGYTRAGAGHWGMLARCRISSANSAGDRLCSESDSALSGSGWTSTSRPWAPAARAAQAIGAT